MLCRNRRSTPPPSGQRQALGVVGELLGPFLVPLRGGNTMGLPAVRFVGAVAERRGGVLCLAPARAVGLLLLKHTQKLIGVGAAAVRAPLLAACTRIHRSAKRRPNAELLSR
jgi:hypothetical protein